MGANILIVEDEEPLTTLLRYNLEAEGYEVDAVARGDDADTRLKETAPDLIVLDWMLPGLAPTGKRVEVPLVAIVQFRDGKLAHEHIYWDQASVLVQLGLLDAGALPVAGVETARKALNPKLPSNALMRR